MDIDAVVKLGGSLIKTGNIRKVTKNLSEELSKDYRILIIVGGGSLADNIRDLDRRFELENKTSHYCAIKCMDINSEIVSDISDKLETVENTEDINRVLSRQRIPVYKTYNFMKEHENHIESWDVTSDSISALIAQSIGASKLILVKEVEGIKSDQGIVEEIRTRDLDDLETSCIDSYLPEVLSRDKLECTIVSGKHIHRLKKVLENEEVVSTKIIY